VDGRGPGPLGRRGPGAPRRKGSGALTAPAAARFSDFTDAQLLAATAQGEEEAFVEIYRRYHERVHRFAFHMTGSADVADDVTHTAFASLLERPRGFAPERSGLGTYLCAAARNQSLKGLRQRRREVLCADPLESVNPRGPLDALLEDERSRAVRAAVLGLAPLHREVVVLFELEGFDLATVAEIVGADVGAVKVRLHRARKKLRHLLESYVGRGADLAGAERRK
jgi:RNA polymerase sigma-70 factor (ECF subfamily)